MPTRQGLRKAEPRYIKFNQGCRRERRTRGRTLPHNGVLLPRISANPAQPQPVCPDTQRLQRDQR